MRAPQEWPSNFMSSAFAIMGPAVRGLCCVRLDAVAPQCVLIEGPPDADDIIECSANAEMRPPVAILVYQSDDARQAAFYPFAEFSPEWCAIRWALEKRVPVRFMDLPQRLRIAMKAADPAEAVPQAVDPTDGDPAHGAEEAAQIAPNNVPATERYAARRFAVRHDPLGELARAAGFDDGERWWEHTFEHRRHADTEVFAAVREAISALREMPESAQTAALLDRDEPFREAWMRRTIREARREFDNVAAICGAWHVPALSEESLKNLKKDDDAKLAGLAKVKTVATWIPWTYDRLATASGYGAGVLSPGWYENHCTIESIILERWMKRVFRLLSDEDIDCSSAHVIEATRLATSLAAIRGRPLADLSDIADACRAVFCFDSDLAMRLISRKLLIGQRLGEVPEDTPLVPLQQDLQRQQKQLRLKPEALEKTLDLDLRNETDLRRSELLHRLRLLGIDWGTPRESSGGKGTFHEIWQVGWDPAFLVRLIELGVWGTTVESAATGYTCHLAANAIDLEQLTRLLGDLMLANLPAAVEALMNRILSTAAVAADVAKLMDAFPPLAKVFRYGNVRQTDKELTYRAIDGVLPRIVVGLGGAVASLNDDAAREMLGQVERVHGAVQLLDSPADLDDWLACLARIADQPSVHGLLRGRSTRMLFDHGKFSGDDVTHRMSLTLSRGTDPPQAAAWIEGFLSSSGLILLHHAELLALIEEWICSISTEVFNEQIPLLRRTFSTFAPAERRQIGERLRAGVETPRAPASPGDEIDPVRAARVLPTLQAIFGVAQNGISPASAAFSGPVQPGGIA